MPDWNDDLSIGDDERLYRRVFVDDPSQLKVDPGTGQLLPSSTSFKSRKTPTSVDIASLTTPSESLGNRPGHYLIEVEVRAARETGCIVVRDANDNNQAHAHIIGTKRDDGLLTDSEAKKLVNKARWVISPPMENEEVNDH